MWLRLFCSSFTSSLDCAIVVFLLFVCVFCRSCDCGFSVLRLCLLWTVRLWFFCSLFVSSLGRAITVSLLFICVFFGLWLYVVFYSSFVSSLGRTIVVFLRFTCGPCDCGFSALRLCLLWAVRLWFFCISFASRTKYFCWLKIHLDTGYHLLIYLEIINRLSFSHALL